MKFACGALAVAIVAAWGHGAPTAEATRIDGAPGESRFVFAACEPAGEVFVIDATNADAAERGRWFGALERCDVDGLVLRHTKGGENACNDIVRCAEAVEGSCARVGSHAEVAFIGNGQCRGSCSSGKPVTVNCA